MVAANSNNNDTSKSTGASVAGGAANTAGPGPRGRLMRRTLTRGESVVASTGLLAAAILVLALGAAAWWSVHSFGQATRTAREQKVQAVAQLLARNAAGAIAADNLSAVQRQVDEASRTHGLSVCRVVVPALNNQVVADAGMMSSAESLPAKWSSGSGELPAEQTETMSRKPNGTLVLRVPVAAPGRGLAELQIEDTLAGAGADPWPVQAGIGVIGTLAMAAMWLAYRAIRRKLRALGAIGEALASTDVIEAREADLVVNPDLGPAAASWNRLLSDRERLRGAMAATQVAEKLGGRRSKDGELGSVCDGLWMGLMLVDEALKVKYVNGAASVLLRAVREELSGSDLRKVMDEPRVLDAIRGVAAGSVRNRVIVEIQRQGEDDLPAPSGKQAAPAAPAGGGSVLRVTVRPLRKEDSAVALVVIEDVTQQRVADEARNSFVAQATHELRTPLTNMRLYLEMLLEGGGGEDPKKRADALNVISQEARRLERIVGDMLSVSEIEAGSMKINRDDVRVNTVFQEMEVDFREQAAAKEIKIKFDLPPKMPVLMGDRDKIVMALHNLVGNAIKYTPAGGEVTVRATEEKGLFTVDVTDNGIGIRDDEREKIFEKFYRAKDRRITSITGTGLGLAIAREVVRMHGGDVTVRSQLDKGSTFTMTLPVHAAA